MHCCRCAFKHTTLPDLQGLETVHHRTIVTIGGTGDDNEHQADVVSSQSRISKPVDLGKFATRQAVVALSCGLHLDSGMENDY